MVRGRWLQQEGGPPEEWPAGGACGPPRQAGPLRRARGRRVLRGRGLQPPRGPPEEGPAPRRGSSLARCARLLRAPRRWGALSAGRGALRSRRLQGRPLPWTQRLRLHRRRHTAVRHIPHAATPCPSRLFTSTYFSAFLCTPPLAAFQVCFVLARQVQPRVRPQRLLLYRASQPRG